MTGRTCRVERDLLITNVEVVDDEAIHSDIVTVDIGHHGHEALRYADIFVSITAAKLLDPDI